ncbi:neprosin family prolyl endopeptidase, partial [Salmonella sp. s58078]|uniref:neprosin family prolyl endopeptidase n=1 Tax=Salmonella sp. s58078 TaxID=3159699 RepID=UPI00397E92CF
MSQIWVFAGSYKSDLNSIEAGWRVDPQLYRDYNTRLFIYWTTDNYNRTGCYDHWCPGFVQISNIIALGGTIFPVSQYSGTQYVITIYV